MSQVIEDPQGAIDDLVADAIETAAEATTTAGEALAKSALVVASASPRWQSKRVLALLLIVAAGLALIIRQRRASDERSDVGPRAATDRRPAGRAS